MAQCGVVIVGIIAKGRPAVYPDDGRVPAAVECRWEFIREAKPFHFLVHIVIEGMDRAMKEVQYLLFFLFSLANLNL